MLRDRYLIHGSPPYPQQQIYPDFSFLKHPKDRSNRASGFLKHRQGLRNWRHTRKTSLSSSTRPMVIENEAEETKENMRPSIPSDIVGYNLEDPSSSVYLKVRILSKVPIFIQKLSSMIVRRVTNFKHNELAYIESNSTTKQAPVLFSASNRYLIYLDILVLLITMVVFWHATFCIVFPLEIKLPFVLRSVAVVVFLIQILVNFNREHLNQNLGLLVSRHQNMKKYAAGPFVYDFVGFAASTTWLFLYDNQNETLIRILSFLLTMKFGSIRKILKKLENLYATTTEMEALISIVSLLLQIFTFVHFLSLLFNAMSMITLAQGLPSWVNSALIEQQSSRVQLYIYGWYWGSTILSTVGFGDITPRNIYQAFIISFVEVLCCAVYGYCINYIGALIGVLSQRKSQHERNMRRLNEYLQCTLAADALKTKVRQHFANRHRIKQIYDPEVEKIMDDNVPSSIRHELLEANNLSILKGIYFFESYSDKFLKQLSLTLNRCIYAPEQHITDGRDMDISLWIVQSGQISEYFNINKPQQVNSATNKYTMPICQYNSFFPLLGKYNFLQDMPYNLTQAISNTFSSAYKVRRAEFLKIISKYKFDYHKFCEIRDGTLGTHFTKRCMACEKLTHNTIECPQIHLSKASLSTKLHLKNRCKNMKKKQQGAKQRLRTPRGEGVTDEKLNSRKMYLNMNFDDDISDEQSCSKIYSIKSLKRFSRRPTPTISEVCRDPTDESIPLEQPEMDVCKIDDRESYRRSSHVSEVIRDYTNFTKKYCRELKKSKSKHVMIL